VWERSRERRIRNLLCFGSCRAKVSIFGVREVKLPKKKNCNVPQMTKITLQKINNKKKKKKSPNPL
jgi:hypothetical protein